MIDPTPKEVLWEPNETAESLKLAPAQSPSLVGVLQRTVSPSLKHFFDQVWVINLKRRTDRLARFWNEIDQAQWPFLRPDVFNAIEGLKVGTPRYWQTWAGSYGCLRSHMTLLERAIQDDVNSILILEDDAIFQDSFGTDVADFLRKVPLDWQCLMLGGQHMNSTPFPVAPGVVRAGVGGGIQRTHCYALRGTRIMKVLYQTWADTMVHCDWVMGPCTARFCTYAPDPFLVGQAGGSSDIVGKPSPPKIWRCLSGYEPVILLYAPQKVVKALNREGWHTGFAPDPATGIDLKLSQIMDNPATAKRRGQLRHWIQTVQADVVAMMKPGICTLWHPSLHISMIRSAVKGRIIEIRAETVAEALEKLPDNLHVYRSATPSGEIRVALLRSPRAVLEVLRRERWHAGRRQDPVTGQDNGIRKLFFSTADGDRRIAGLREIVLKLHQEICDYPEKVVTIWHDDITAEMLKSDGVRVIEIVAASADEANLKLNEISSLPATPYDSSGGPALLSTSL